MLQVSIYEVRDLIITTMKAGIVPMLHGSPAIGKSAIMRSIADLLNLELIDLRLSQLDPVDLNGFPYIDKDTKRASYCPMDFFPVVGDTLPEGKKGWLLFVDEINSADRGTQKAAYKLILDRMVGQYHLHPNCLIVAAGNKATDNAIVEEMGTALRSRMAHFNVHVPDQTGWIAWATVQGIDHTVISFINFKPNLMYSFDPNTSEHTFPSPRTWEFADRILKQKPEDKQLLPLLTAVIGEGTAREYIGFRKVYKHLPSFASIEADPTTTKVPDEPSTLYAITGMLAERLTLDNVAKVITYIKRMPVEFQTICLRPACLKNRDLMRDDTVQAWLEENGAAFF